MRFLCEIGKKRHTLFRSTMTPYMGYGASRQIPFQRKHTRRLDEFGQLREALFTGLAVEMTSNCTYRSRDVMIGNKNEIRVEKYHSFTRPKNLPWNT